MEAAERLRVSTGKIGLEKQGGIGKAPLAALRVLTVRDNDPRRFGSLETFALNVLASFIRRR